MIKWAMGTGFVLLSALAWSDVRTENGWARLLPPVVKTTAGYLEIASDTPDRLLSASSVAAQRVEIHQTQMKDGMMNMSEVAGIDVLAGETLNLAPGGYHLMIIGLKSPLQEGAFIPVQLQLEKAGPLDVNLRIRAE